MIAVIVRKFKILTEVMYDILGVGFTIAIIRKKINSEVNVRFAKRQIRHFHNSLNCNIRFSSCQVRAPHPTDNHGTATLLQGAIGRGRWL